MELRGDGSYDTRDVFLLLKSLSVTPLITVRVNSNTRAKGKDRSRALAVLGRPAGRETAPARIWPA